MSQEWKNDDRYVTSNGTNSLGGLQALLGLARMEHTKSHDSSRLESRANSFSTSSSPVVTEGQSS
jgi:hypothetical protein